MCLLNCGAPLKLIAKKRVLRMKLYNWFIVLFSLVLISFKGAEASYSTNLIRGLVYNQLYKAYITLFSLFRGRDFLRLLPGPVHVLAIENSDNSSEENLALVSIFEDNKDLRLGDVLIDRDGQVFFFMSPTRNDPIVSTLMRASNGFYELDHEINLYTVIKKYEEENCYYLDFMKYPKVGDLFKVLQEYEGFTLLGSSCHSIVFVAPSSDVEGFICGEFQKRIQNILARERENSRSQGFMEILGMGQDGAKQEEQSVLIARENGKNVPNGFLKSPDSIANFELLEDASHIEILFGKSEESTDLKFKFVSERLVIILLESGLSLYDAFVIVNRAEEVFRRERTVEFIKVTRDEDITVVGDIHGQFTDLLRIFKNRGWPSESKKYLFNGDIVDRGQESVQCLLLLYALKITFPRSVFINRGNHESEMCGIGTFYRDMQQFDPSGVLFKTAQKGFEALPLAHVINDRIYVVHGGMRADYSIDELSKIDRFNLNKVSKDFLNASLWDDSTEEPGITSNRLRGPSSHCFGPDVTEAFLERNELNLLIRSHTYVPNGIEVSQGGKCWTLFSAPNYCGMRNHAVIVTFDSDLVPQFHKFGAKF